MKELLKFFKKGVIFFDAENKKNIEKVQNALHSLNEKKESQNIPKTNKPVDNNKQPNYNEQKEILNELEKQLKDASKNRK